MDPGASSEASWFPKSRDRQSLRSMKVKVLIGNHTNEYNRSTPPYIIRQITVEDSSWFYRMAVGTGEDQVGRQELEFKLRTEV